MLVRSILSAVLLAATPIAALAQAVPEGYLCCNMRTDGAWISDINYISGTKLVPVGTPVKVKGYGRHRVFTELGGTEQAIGNDYSRDISLETFAKRYVVERDPKLRIATFAPKVREAINNAKLVPGMTREQVLMSVGYPVSSENPNLEAAIWRYWLSSFEEFQVVFDGNGIVKEIAAMPLVRNQIVLE